LNPSFKPPTPLSDARRQQIFDQFIFDPKVNNVRALAARNGISIKRVDAILRLKGLEASWKKVRIYLSVSLARTCLAPLE
jgi:predicted xylose isomerase-like sugar epimerase